MITVYVSATDLSVTDRQVQIGALLPIGSQVSIGERSYLVDRYSAQENSWAGEEESTIYITMHVVPA